MVWHQAIRQKFLDFSEIHTHLPNSRTIEAFPGSPDGYIGSLAQTPPLGGLHVLTASPSGQPPHFMNY